MRFEDYIEIRPGVRAGKPCFKGTRITVYDVLEYLAGEMTEDELLDDFPDLSRIISSLQGPIPLLDDNGQRPVLPVDPFSLRDGRCPPRF